MNTYLKYLKFSFLFLILMILVPSQPKAATVHYKTNCASASAYPSYAWVNPNCEGNLVTEAKDGMYFCAAQSMDIWTTGIHIPDNQTGKRIIGHYYVVGRVDVWIDSLGNFEQNSALYDPNTGTNIQTCPEMGLKYTTQHEIGEDIYSELIYFDNDSKYNYKNIKVKNIAVINLNDDYTRKQLGDTNITNIGKYMIKNLKIESESTGWDIYNASSPIKYRVEIDKLITNNTDNGGLGVNGTNSYLNNSGAKAIHYLVPLDITFEFDNPNPQDPCQNQGYAYENPGKCCEQYPESCCNDVEFIKKKNKENPEYDYLGFCCGKESEATYGLGTIKLKTFKSYFGSDSNYESRFLGPDGICPTCDDINDYSYKETTGKSYCCEQFPNKYPDRCQPDPNVCSKTNNKCTNEDYFNKNTPCCCGLYGEGKLKEKCKEKPTTWKESLSCNKKGDSSRILANSGSGLKYESVTLYETVAFTDYKMKAHMEYTKNHIKSGMGFDYDITVEHTVERVYTNSLNLSNFYDSYTAAYNAVENKGKEVSANINPENYKGVVYQDVIEKNFKSYPFKFTSNSKTQNYVLKKDNNNVKIQFLGSQPGKKTSTITAWYCAKYEDGVCTSEASISKTVNISKIFKYEYTITLEQQYIAKLDGKTYNTATKKEEYLDGGHKFYTETTTKTGVYDFKVTIENSGLTGKLSTTTDGFTCQYGVVNKITDYSCALDKNTCDDSEKDKNKDGGRGYYFRPISLSDPFPNGRDRGFNWQGNANSGQDKAKEYITEKGDSVYSGVMYEVTLDSDLIKKIRDYNKSVGYKYDWTNMSSTKFDNLDSTSNFLSGTGSNQIIWSDKLKMNFTNDNERRTKVGDF